MEFKNLVTRYFTKSLEGTSSTVFDLFTWHTIDISLKDYKSGQVILHMENLEFPTHFSQTACDIIASKYFRKNGLIDAPHYETSFKQLVHRMVSFWINSALDENLVTEENKQIAYDELCYMLIAQMWAPNSPQWFNTGLALSYGIEGPKQGHYYYDETIGDVVLSKDAYTRTQGSACFIVSVDDALLGDKSITDQLAIETRLFKYGSGVGSNWSSIRGKGELLSGGGKSSGLMSFLKVFDRNAGAIKSGGTTRRAAKMNILNIDHPEVEDFITWKATEEDKVAALGKMGYDTHFDGEAYDTVSGQNANNSIRVTDAFMAQVEAGKGDVALTNRLDGKISKTVSSQSLFEKISKAAWRCGDPGMQFDDTINSWHTCPYGENGDPTDSNNRINGSNPCSEYMFLDDTACNLASINILKFYDNETKTFDIAGYKHAISLVQLILEATIHHGQFPTKEIARRSYHFRTTGLGLTNLGALLMLMGLPYDSEEARSVSAALMSLLTGQAYYTSALMAKDIGAFTYFDLNKEPMLRVLSQHAFCAGVAAPEAVSALNYDPVTLSHAVLEKMGLQALSQTLKEVWADTLNYGNTYGYRNAQVSVLAPTGTIAFAMDCATTSLEPFFSHVAYKKLVGGGSLEIVNPILPQTLANLGYTQAQIKDITAYILRKEEKDGYSYLVDGQIEGAPHLKEEHYSIFDTANKCGFGKRYIAPEGHVKMMAALTPHVSGAISKTVNLPSHANIETIASIYLLSWKLGVKAIALYRDGCKESQPLSSSLEETTQANLEDLNYKDLLEYAKNAHTKVSPTRNKPTGIRTARVHEAQINGLRLYITVSFYEDGRLGELYVSAGKQGSIVKGLLDSISTTISKMLQYGVSPQIISEMYRGQKFEPSGFVGGHPYIKKVDSISDLISKIIDIELGDYTYCQVKPNEHFNASSVHSQPSKEQEGEVLHGEVCSHCQSTRLIKNGTCKVCQDCGTTTGCS
jgi:ribonucleoside-diphosphate reductase alpha chain